MLLSEVVSDCRSFVFFNSLVQVSARVADIACITQATLERIHHALLTHKRRLVFLDLNFIFDLPTENFLLQKTNGHWTSATLPQSR